MITLKLQGGLGNQMFIYAFAKTLEQMGYEVCLDASIYNFYRQKEHDINSSDKMGGGGLNIKNICQYASLSFLILILVYPSSTIPINGHKTIR